MIVCEDFGRSVENKKSTSRETPLITSGESRFDDKRGDYKHCWQK